MDKSHQSPTPITESTQLNGKADKLTVKSRSKIKVKSDISVNNDNQVGNNNQPDLFKSELDIVNTIIPDDVNIDYNTLIEQSIVKTPDISSTLDTTAAPDTSSVLYAPTKSTSDSMPNMSDAGNIADESSYVNSSEERTPSTESNDAVNVTESDEHNELVEPKPIRISAKQRREELDRFKTTYLTPHKFEKKHNLAIEDEQWIELERIARILGDRNSNVASYINSILLEHLKTYSSDIEVWRKL